MLVSTWNRVCLNSSCAFTSRHQKVQKTVLSRGWFWGTVWTIRMPERRISGMDSWHSHSRKKMGHVDSCLWSRQGYQFVWVAVLGPMWHVQCRINRSFLSTIGTLQKTLQSRCRDLPQNEDELLLWTPPIAIHVCYILRKAQGTSPNVPETGIGVYWAPDMM